MACWAAAFVGDHARENYERCLGSGSFWVSSDRTPIRKVRPGDDVLLYLARDGFIGKSVAASQARTPYGEEGWAGSRPVLGLSLEKVERFSVPVTYKFPHKGPHPTLGFHRFALTGGLTHLSEEGLKDVLARDGGTVEPPSSEPVQVSVPKAKVAEATSVPRPAMNNAATEVREKRGAGQHALGKGRKRAVLWTMAEVGAQVVGWKKAERHAQGKVRDAERTWIAGGAAEQRVGEQLLALGEHGFYVFHDVQLPEVGNVDHVALGPHGFFAIETKSHKGHVKARGNTLLLNGRSPERDFISQTWRGCYRLKEILGADVVPILCFTEAFVDRRVFVKGVRVIPLSWLNEALLKPETKHDSMALSTAVDALGAATGCHPSSVPGID